MTLSNAIRACVCVALAIGSTSEAGAQTIRRAPDTTPPSISIARPAPGERIETFTPEIEIEYDDEGTGVAVVSFRALINDREHSAEFEHHSRGASGRIAPSNPLPLGENKLTIELADRAGNVGRAESTFINAGGGWLTAIADPGLGLGRHVELVFDASGSMSDMMLDSTRMEVAKGAVKNLIKTLPTDTPLGLRVFTACDAIRSLIPIAKVNKAAFNATIEKIEPSGGTPIVAALLQSFEALAKLQDIERVTVLVTDGGESCGGALKDAAENAKELSIRLIVISFGQQATNEQLSKLAEETGGAYFNALDGAELQAALERSVLRLSYGVYDAQGIRVSEGEVNGERLMLPIGAYQVRFDLRSSKVVQDVTIVSLGEVTVRLRQSGARVSAEVLAGK
ncbi:MAG TPA: VWA domain-containing protein [Thermoanaerobaculia bacterium]|nr:VWA domain-containing protein [Thermoanaerobaculia bacterium]